MTPEELQKLTPEERWNLFSCASQCLIKLAEMNGKPISKDDFMAKFGNIFPPLHEGLTSAAEQIEIAKGLGLCQTALALRDLRAVREMVDKKQQRGILVLTDRHPVESNAALFHCRLHCGCDETNVSLFSPFQDGTAPILPDTWANLEKQLVHFLVFR